MIELHLPEGVYTDLITMKVLDWICLREKGAITLKYFVFIRNS